MTLFSDDSVFMPWDCCKLVQLNYCAHRMPQCFMHEFVLVCFLLSILASLTHDTEILGDRSQPKYYQSKIDLIK